MNEKLEPFQKNILTWYPFQNKETILQIGGNQRQTAYLETIFETVITLSTPEEKIQFETDTKIQFDYILWNDFTEKNNLLATIISLLKQDGKLLLLVKNEIGINTWSKYSKEEKDKGIQLLENKEKKFLTLTNIKEKLAENKIPFTNTFFVFPDSEKTECIINEKFEVTDGQLESYAPNISSEEIRVFNEIKVLKTLVKQDKQYLQQLANEYLIEASKEEIQTDINYVSFNNVRKEPYRLITLLRESIVEKIPANTKAMKQIEDMKIIIKQISR